MSYSISSMGENQYSTTEDVRHCSRICNEPGRSWLTAEERCTECFGRNVSPTYPRCSKRQRRKNSSYWGSVEEAVDKNVESGRKRRRGRALTKTNKHFAEFETAGVPWSSTSFASSLWLVLRSVTTAFLHSQPWSPRRGHMQTMANPTPERRSGQCPTTVARRVILTERLRPIVTSPGKAITLR